MEFVNQQQGGGGGLKDLATLMGLLGLGEGQGEEERQSKAQQAQQAYYEGLIGQQVAAGGREQEKLGMTKAEAAAAAKERLAAEEARQETRRYQQEATLRDIKARESEEGYKNFAQIMASPDYTQEEKRRIASKRSPEAAAVEAEIKKEKGEKFTAGLEEAYKGAAKNPKSIAAFLESQKAIPDYEEMLKSVDWQRLNQGMPAPQPGLLSRLLGGGGAGTPAVSAVGQGGVWQHQIPQATEFRRPEEEQQVALPTESVPPSVDKVMEVAGVTGRNAAPPFVYEPGGPSAMPGVVQQPGFLENFLQQISDYTASRPERVPVERYPYPIGHGVPPTPPIDPRLLQ
jgi:hypothetical protein